MQFFAGRARDGDKDEVLRLSQERELQATNAIAAWSKGGVITFCRGQ